MLIKTLDIKGVGGIENLSLSFHPQMNVLCGPNGIGKTTILETIAHIFSHGNTDILKKNVNSEKSSISIRIVHNKVEHGKTIEFDTFIPEKKTEITNSFSDLSSNILSLKTNRIFQYQLLDSVPRDSEKERYYLWQDAINGISLSNIKSWFVNRYLYSAHGTLTEEQIKNLELAKSSFSYLNESFSFSKVEAASNEIMVNTPTGEIYYEYLSSGFKSIISIIFGIIKEIEFRFVSPRVAAVDFDGVILIDEVELHLHPEWQEQIVNVLLKTFPKAQFFATTHSPHVIQTAKPNQIIALGNQGNRTIQRTLPNTEFGFQGWTVEEVLTDVMGMTDTRTTIFNNMMSNFQKAIDEENHQKASEVYNTIDSLLHPENTLRKLLKFQLAGIK